MGAGATVDLVVTVLASQATATATAAWRMSTPGKKDGMGAEILDQPL
jgi:hypothetical protein